MAKKPRWEQLGGDNPSDFSKKNTNETFNSTKTIGYNNTINSATPINPEVGAISLLNLAVENGEAIFNDTDFANGNNGVSGYSNVPPYNGQGYITITNEANASAPNKSKKVLKVTNPTGALGGWIQLFYTPNYNDTIIQKFTAKVPAGITLNLTSNAIGTNGELKWLSPNVGTGKWETYVALIQVGHTGPLDSAGHIYVNTGQPWEILIAKSNAYNLSGSILKKLNDSLIANYIPYKNATQHTNLNNKGLKNAFQVMCGESFADYGMTGLFDRNFCNLGHKNYQVTNILNGVDAVYWDAPNNIYLPDGSMMWVKSNSNDPNMTFVSTMYSPSGFPVYGNVYYEFGFNNRFANLGIFKKCLIEVSTDGTTWGTKLDWDLDNGSQYTYASLVKTGATEGWGFKYIRWSFSKPNYFNGVIYLQNLLFRHVSHEFAPQYLRRDGGKVYGDFALPEIKDKSNDANYNKLIGVNALGDISKIGISQFLTNYYTKSESQNAFVGINSTQTIGGTKTFSNPIISTNATINEHLINLGQANELYELKFSKNTAFNKDFGTTLGTVAQGNDSRIANGQTAYTWGNHAGAGYSQKNVDETIGGAKSYIHNFPLSFWKTGYKTWTFHKPANFNSFILTSSNSIDDADWNWANQIEFKDSGRIKGKGFEIAGKDDTEVLTAGGNSVHKKNLLWSKKENYTCTTSQVINVAPKGQVTNIQINDDSTDANTIFKLSREAYNGQILNFINLSDNINEWIESFDGTTTVEIPPKSFIQLTFIRNTAGEDVLQGTGYWVGKDMENNIKFFN